MFHQNTILSKIVATILLAASTYAVAETSIPMVVTFSPGGPSDRVWKTVEPYVQAELKDIALVTDYRLGAGGVIGANSVSNALNPTVILLSTAHTIAPTMNADAVKYNANDFTILAHYGNLPMVLVTTNNGPKNVAEFTQLCQHKSLTFGSGGVGSATHLFGELVAKNLKCKPVVHIPYKGAANTQIDLIGGRLDYMVDFPSNAAGMVEANKLQAIAIVGSTDRIKFMPKVTEIVAPNAEISNWHAFAINSSATNELKNKLQLAFIHAKMNLELRAKLADLGVVNLDFTPDSSWLQDQISINHKFISDINTAQSQH